MVYCAVQRIIRHYIGYSSTTRTYWIIQWLVMYPPFELLGPGVYSMVCWQWGFLSEHNTKQYYSSSGQLFSFSKLPCPTCSERWRLSFWPPPRVLPLPPWAISPRLWPSSFHWIEPQRQRVHKRVETIYTTYIYIQPSTIFHISLVGLEAHVRNTQTMDLKNEPQ